MGKKAQARDEALWRERIAEVRAELAAAKPKRRPEIQEALRLDLEHGAAKGYSEQSSLGEQYVASAPYRDHIENMREAAAEADAEPLTKAERKALKRSVKQQQANRLAINTGVPAAEAADTIATAEATAPKAKGKGKAVATGAVVTSAPIPDVEDVVAAQAPASTELVAPAELKPSVEPIERDRWGRPKVKAADGSGSTGYRRVTTFIDVLEDKSSLAAWGKRQVLEGVAVDYSSATHSAALPSIINRATTVLTERDEALDKLRNADDVLSTGPAEQAALKAFKDAMNALVDDAEGMAGTHDKATKGTDLHAMTELVDAGKPLPDDATAADRRDIAAYQAAIKQAGIVFTHAEQFVVLDDLGVGGTLDRGGRYKFKGTQRARQCVMDIKTGRIDYSAGKIAMQLATYAHGLGYDRDTGVRTDLKLDKTKALLIHLPAGEGRCLIYEVDIAPAWSKAVRLAEDVYTWRKLGKQAFDIGSPVVSVVTA